MEKALTRSTWFLKATSLAAFTIVLFLSFTGGSPRYFGVIGFRMMVEEQVRSFRK